MKNLRSLLGFILLSFTNVSYSQIWAEAKDMSYLEDEEEVYLKFNYDQLKIEDVWTVNSFGKTGKPNQLKTEKEFLRMKAEKYDMKGNGQGQHWVKDWEENKKNELEPRFEKLFNRGTRHRLLGKRFDDDLKFTILINVKEMRLGGGGYATCDFEVLIYETEKPSLILSRALMYGVCGLKYSRWSGPLGFFLPFLGIGTVFSDFSKRVKDCYAQCGKDLGEQIRLSCRKG